MYQAEAFPSEPPPDSAPPSSAPARTGELIDGRYLLGDRIAYGGMGVVYAATHLDLDRPVALKFIRAELADDSVIVARFLNEARSVARLGNEHVARVLDFGKLPSGVPYLVMERLEGADLATALVERGPMPVATAVDYVLQACEALAEAHARGIVHRDIKPENLFLTHAVDGAPVIKVLDFGISKQLASKPERSFTHPRRTIGSPWYMSPEQMRNPQLVDARTDIWSMGVVLFQLLTGQLPFDGETLPEVCGRVLCDPPLTLCQVRPELPRQLDAIVRHCLQKDPASRFSDIGELAQALDAFSTSAFRSSASSIERILNGAEHSDSGIRPLSSEAISALRSEPPVRSARPSDSDGIATMIATPVTFEARRRIPGERPLWPTVLCCFAALAMAGVTGARRAGYDVTDPLKGVVIPAELRATLSDGATVAREFTPWLAPLRETAWAETELEVQPSAPASRVRARIYAAPSDVVSNHANEGSSLTAVAKAGPDSQASASHRTNPYD